MTEIRINVSALVEGLCWFALGLVCVTFDLRMAALASMVGGGLLVSASIRGA